MLESTVIILYTTLFILNHATSPEHNTFCVTGSVISSLVDGKYEYNSNTNANDSIYYNQQLDLYLFPWVESVHFKQYLIGPDPTRYRAHSFSTIQVTPPYSFIEEDFITNWQSWVVIDSAAHLVNDSSMRLVNCNPVYIESVLYNWINYSISIESSIYHNTSNGLYLYRSNIGTHKEKWQIYNGTNFETVAYINITSHIRTNTTENTETFNETVELPSNINITSISYIHTNVNTTELSNIKQYEVVTKHDKKNDFLIVIIVTSSAVLVMLISIVVIVKKYVVGNKENTKTANTSTQSQTNSKPETNSKVRISNAQSKVIQELQIKIRSPSSVHDGMKKKSLSVFLNDGEMWNTHSRKSSVNSMRSRSSSKYADILPPGKPPPIGMRPVLTAKQQATRPLPPTPSADKDEGPIVIETGDMDDVLNLNDLI